MELLKAAKFGAIALIVAAGIYGYIHIRSIINERDRAQAEIAELRASLMPDTADADVVIVYHDSAAIADRDRVINSLRLKILQLARTPAETVTVETYLKDTLNQAIEDIPCDKTIRGDYLYQANGITAHISSLTDCRRDSVTFAVGAYYKPKKTSWSFDRINIGVGYWDKIHFSVSAQILTPWGFSVGPALIDNAVGLSVGLKF